MGRDFAEVMKVPNQVTVEGRASWPSWVGLTSLVGKALKAELRLAQRRGEIPPVENGFSHACACQCPVCELPL